MYTYGYERVHVEIGKVLWDNKRFLTDDFRPVIERRAQEGWRYVGYIPAEQMGTGVISELDLIFEKEQDAP